MWKNRIHATYNKFFVTFIGFLAIWLVEQLVSFPMKSLNNQKHYFLQTLLVSGALETL